VRTVCLRVLLATIVLGLALLRVLAEENSDKKEVPGEAVEAESVDKGAEPSDRRDETGTAEAAPGIGPGAQAREPAAVPTGDKRAERRDPFRPFIKRETGKQAQGEEEGVGVTAFEIQQLTLVGVLMDVTPPRALLQDSSGMGYVVTPGVRVGRHGGIVAAIEPGRLIVEEKTSDFYGHEQLTRRVLDIPRDIEPRAAGRGKGKR
jgi:Tfp pilus assembly protein PilP